MEWKRETCAEYVMVVRAHCTVHTRTACELNSGSKSMSSKYKYEYHWSVGRRTIDSFAHKCRERRRASEMIIMTGGVDERVTDNFDIDLD